MHLEDGPKDHAVLGLHGRAAGADGSARVRTDPGVCIDAQHHVVVGAGSGTSQLSNQAVPELELDLVLRILDGGMGSDDVPCSTADAHSECEEPGRDGHRGGDLCSECLGDPDLASITASGIGSSTIDFEVPARSHAIALDARLLDASEVNTGSMELGIELHHARSDASTSIQTLYLQILRPKRAHIGGEDAEGLASSR